MLWKKINNISPALVSEFKEYFEANAAVHFNDARNMVHLGDYSSEFLSGWFKKWLDKKGLFIFIDADVVDRFQYKIKNGFSVVLATDRQFYNRDAALRNAIIRAFELLKEINNSIK